MKRPKGRTFKREAPNLGIRSLPVKEKWEEIRLEAKLHWDS